MANSIFSRLYSAFKTFDQAVDIILGRSFPPGNLYAIECSVRNQIQSGTLPGKSVKDILNDAFLWAVPKKRRTIEKRLNRRFGNPKYIWKPHVPKTDILMCRKCGHNHQAGMLCGYCYEIVKKETKEIQSEIKKSLDLNPVEQDVIVLYEGEKEGLKGDYWKNQRIVELPKKRPEWFSQNLLQSTAEETADSNRKRPEDESSDNIKSK